MKNIDYYYNLYSYFTSLEDRILKHNPLLDREVTVRLFQNLDILDNSNNPQKIVDSCEQILCDLETILLDCFDSDLLGELQAIKVAVLDGYKKIKNAKC